MRAIALRDLDIRPPNLLGPRAKDVWVWLWYLTVYLRTFAVCFFHILSHKLQTCMLSVVLLLQERLFCLSPFHPTY